MHYLLGKLRGLQGCLRDSSVKTSYISWASALQKGAPESDCCQLKRGLT